MKLPLLLLTAWVIGLAAVPLPAVKQLPDTQGA